QQTSATSTAWCNPAGIRTDGLFVPQFPHSTPLIREDVNQTYFFLPGAFFLAADFFAAAFFWPPFLAAPAVLPCFAGAACAGSSVTTVAKLPSACGAAFSASAISMCAMRR